MFGSFERWSHPRLALTGILNTHGGKWGGLSPSHTLQPPQQAICGTCKVVLKSGECLRCKWQAERFRSALIYLREWKRKNQKETGRKNPKAGGDTNPSLSFYEFDVHPALCLLGLQASQTQDRVPDNPPKPRFSAKTTAFSDRLHAGSSFDGLPSSRPRFLFGNEELLQSLHLLGLTSKGQPLLSWHPGNTTLSSSSYGQWSGLSWYHGQTKLKPLLFSVLSLIWDSLPFYPWGSVRTYCLQKSYTKI